ncbi:MAG: glycoside hydrolase family 3 C-terminal domain-containing protein [Candidatus Methylacidiphilales bacterium]|nr:glycoside hydrolase family 3 C-terminal domain-containing protein [Candidatus Methylacidiphilales bacterium]
MNKSLSGIIATKLLLALMILGGASVILCTAHAQAQPYTPTTTLFMNPDKPLEERVTDLISRLTLEEKAMLLNHRGTEVERFHILSDNWNQCLHGVRWTSPTTLYPIPTAMAATWNPPLVHQVADATSDEARAIYNAWHDDPSFKGNKSGLIYRSPVINILRNPYWGRNSEAWTEDPYLCGRMAVAFIQGLQGNDPRYLKLASTPKHFAVNNVEENRQKLSAAVSERMLHEYWLPHFRDAIVEGKARSVMASYNQINGVHNVYNHHLLTKILKQDWGFDGFVVSDLGGVHDREMVVKSVNAGCDFSDKEFMQFIPAAVRAGEITEERLNEALARVLRVRFRLGEFDPADRVPWRKIPMSVVCSPQHRDLSLQVSRQSIVLLKNADNLLPLDRASIKKLAVIGPLANRLIEGDGSYIGAPNRKTVSILQGIRDRAPGIEVVFDGSGIISPKKTKDSPEAPSVDTTDPFLRAVELAKSADAAIVCVGTDLSVEMEGRDRKTLALPGNQQRLVEAVMAANPRTIVVLINAGPLTIPWIKEHVPSILSAWWSGEEQGHAVADVLFGDVNPGGHLPYTVYASEAQVPPQDEYDISKGFTYMYLKGEALFPFGHGLSYTTFVYSDLHLSHTTAQDGDSITATLKVSNTGTRDGDEVVQIYVQEPAGNVVKPQKRLVGFKRISIKAGTQETVSIPVEVARMRYWNESTHAFVAEPGKYELKAGSSSSNLPLSASFSIPR